MPRIRRRPAGRARPGATSLPVLPVRVMWSAGAAAAGAAGCPAPGRARGRFRGRAVPGQVSGRRWDGESRPLRSVTSMDDAGGARGTARGTARRESQCREC